MNRLKASFMIIVCLAMAGMFVSAQGVTVDALEKAVKDGNSAEVKRLLDSGADIHAKNKSGWTALHFAAYDGKKQIAEMLLARGMDPNTGTNDGTTALTLAAMQDHPDIVDLLLTKGANANTVNTDGFMPLGYVKSKAVAEALLKSGAQVTARAKMGTTPLLGAAELGNIEIFDLLLSRGADIKDRDAEGNDALMTMIIGTRLSSYFMRQDQKISGELDKGTETCGKAVEHMISKGVPPNNRNNAGDTALHLLAGDGMQGCAAVLVKLGGDVTAKNKAGKTPAMVAKEKGFEKLAKMLEIK